MPDTITFTTEAGGQTLTINDGFRLDRDISAKDLNTVHVPFSKVSFLRDFGEVQASIQVLGLETFGDVVDANSFRNQIESMQGLDCTIDHNNLSEGSTVTAKCLTPSAVVDTNFFPGFHVTYSIPFAKYP